MGLIRVEGIWLPPTGALVSGSRTAASPAKFPDLIAALGWAVTTGVEVTRRSPSNVPKKKSLFFRIGPPREAPYSLRLNAGLGRLVAKKLLAASTRLRLNSKT